MDLSIFNDPEGFRQRVISALARAPVDFLEQLAFIHEQKNQAPWEGAGVILPIFFERKDREGAGEYVFLLNKRSRTIRQGGDLCAPGGGVHPFLDGVLEKLLLFGLLPWARGAASDLAKQKGKPVYEKILFFLGNALRESWEEIRLKPSNVEFLGALPAYRLESRKWVIFPLVGRVKQGWKYKLSPEVDEIVYVPLHLFFQPERYALYSLEVPESLVAQGIPNPWEFPCLVYGEDEKEEILWGATFKIILSFLRIVFDDPIPMPAGSRVIRKLLDESYLSGRK